MTHESRKNAERIARENLPKFPTLGFLQFSQYQLQELLTDVALAALTEKEES